MEKSLKDRIHHILWNNEPYMTLDMCLRVSNQILEAITEYINEEK